MVLNETGSFAHFIVAYHCFWQMWREKWRLHFHIFSMSNIISNELARKTTGAFAVCSMFKVGQNKLGMKHDRCIRPFFRISSSSWTVVDQITTDACVHGVYVHFQPRGTQMFNVISNFWWLDVLVYLMSMLWNAEALWKAQPIDQTVVRNYHQGFERSGSVANRCRRENQISYTPDSDFPI